MLAVLLAWLAGLVAAQEVKMKPLTPEEQRVILHKGTERPFSGKYYDHYEKGTYLCRQCGAELYRSESKFESDCGWPSFDDEVPGAVKRVPDADGRRTEIICANCGGHLGHVFTGEHFTAKNTRHCVNSVSMSFLPDAPAKPEAPATQTAIFAGGCFWGVEYYFQNAEGVTATRVGYTGGHKENPTYKDVCNGKTGHIEALEVTYDPTKTTYEKMAKLFFEIHDPTQVDRQGPDVGEQYRSVVFYANEKQKATAQKLIDLLKDKGYNVATELRPATTFWPAEDYHQQYYQKKNGTPYCHIPIKRFD